MGLEVMQALVGLVVLLSGRIVFWLCVALTGFLLGAEIAAAAFVGQPNWLVLVVAALVGTVGAFVAVFAERVAFALVGLYAGGYLGLVVATLIGAPAAALAFGALGAGFGMVVAILATDWAIIVLTSLAGASAVVSAFALDAALAAVAVLVLAMVGVAVQSSASRRLSRSRA